MSGITANFRTRVLSRGNVRVACGPATFRLLTGLLARRASGGGILTKKELIDHVYGDEEEGGPDAANMAVNTLIFHARQGQHRHRAVLRSLGLSIIAHGHRGYTIEVCPRAEFAEAAE